MYKVIFNVIGNNTYLSSIRELRKAGFVPIYFKRDNGKEQYIALYNSNDINEIKEAISDFAYLISRQGKYGSFDFARIYKIDEKYFGKVAGSGLGAILGYQYGGILGLLLGVIGGMLLGELVDMQLGEILVGVMSWPIQLLC